MTRFLTWLLILVAVVAAVGLALRPRPLLVDARRVVVAPMHVGLVHEGATRVEDRYLVTAPLAGMLRRIPLREGDAVASGTTELAVIEPGSSGLLDERAMAAAESLVDVRKAAHLQAQATIARVAASLEQERGELQRMQRLHAGGDAPARELEVAQREVAWWEGELRAAQAGVQVAQAELEWARAGLLQARPGTGESGPDAVYPLVAPVHGTVLRVHRRSAGPVAAQEPLLEIGDLSRLELVADFLSTDAVRMEPGMPARVTGWGGERTLDARVRRVEPSGFTKVSALGVEEQRVNVLFDLLPDDGGTLPPLGDGYRVEVEVVLWQDDAVLQVPEGALFRDSDGGWAVFVVEDDHARPRAVEIGRRDGLSAQVLDGLAEDELVVLYPADAVRDGALLEPRVL